MRHWFYFAALLILTFNCQHKNNRNLAGTGDADANGITTRVVKSGLEYPWEIVWGPDNYIWLTERDGRIARLNPANGNLYLTAKVAEVVSNGEGGMLGLAFHPDFAKQPFVYVAYNYESGTEGYREKIVRYRYNGNTLVQPVIILDHIEASSIHNGCRLLFGTDKKLYITTGDAASPANAQNKTSLNGKILRVNDDGSIPADNPVAGSPVWSWGHRNAQGLVLANGILYSSEHGPNNDDEVNIIEKNRNYGWPDVEGFCDRDEERRFCQTNNVMEPLKAWTPTLAVCGLDYYAHDRIPQWKNSLLLCTLKANKFLVLKLSEDKRRIVNETIYFAGQFGRLRDVCVSPQGKVYFCTSNGGDADKVVEVSFTPR